LKTEGQFLNLTCATTSRFVEWRKGWRPITDDGRYLYQHNLLIFNVAGDDAGRYFCNDGDTGKNITEYNVTVKGITRVFHSSID